MTNIAPRRLLLGKIGAAHGVRGLVKLTIFAGEPQSLNSYGRFYTSETGDATVGLRTTGIVGKSWLGAVENVADRNAAELLRGTELWVGRDQLPVLEQPGEYYVADLIGLQVLDDAKQVIGRISAVDNFGAGDLLEIQPVSGAAFYLPFLKEYLIAVDLAAGTIAVTIPEDLTTPSS